MGIARYGCHGLWAGVGLALIDLALGRIVVATDRNGNTTGYNLDASGDIIEVIDALGID